MFAKVLVAALTATLLVGCTDEPDTTSPAVEPSPELAPEPAGGPEAAPAPVAGSEAAGGGSGLPQTIEIERGGFIPEGIEYDQTNARFLVGSLAEGTVFEIGNDGSMTPFVMDEALVSSVGIEVDEPRNRLLVCNADSAAFQGQSSGQAMLGIYDLETGERTAMVDLTAALGDEAQDATFFANDVAVGDDGTAYVTDTMMHVVYQVDSSDQPSVLYRFEGMPGPNGIVHHEAGFLLVVAGGDLYRIPTDDPDAAAQVMLTEPLDGGDGMVWAADGSLAVVSNSSSSVIALTSDDDWASATVAGTAPFEGQGTTAAVAEDALYVVKPHFNDQDPPSIERVELQ